MISRSRWLPALTLLAACGGTAAGGRQPAPSGGEDPARLHIYEVAPEQVAEAARQRGVIEVSGTAAVAVSPDRAVVSFAVESAAEAAHAASADNAQAMTATIAAVRASGVAGLVIETHGYTLRPDYGTVVEDGRQVRVIQGYTALNNVRVQIGDVDAVGTVIDAAIGAGANRVSGLTFVASDTDAARREALTAAVAQAKGEAETIAAALGHELGVALEVRGGAELPMPRGDVGLMRAEAVATPVEAADQMVIASVSVRFALGSRRGGG